VRPERSFVVAENKETGMEYVFETEMMVRDYECDLQGIVNNSVYQNYLEHARHEFLHEAGLDFDRLCRDGMDAVVTRIEMDYKTSLRPRDRFVVRLAVRRKGRLRIIFDQEICRREDDCLVLKAQVHAVLTRNGRPIAPTPFDRILGPED
jgi:acyl-CoA thioester hydrolase